MAKQKPNGRWLAQVRDIFGNRRKQTFNSKAEAVAWESKFNLEKYESKLIKNGVRKQRYQFDQTVDDFLLTKSDLRESSIAKYTYVMTELKKFVNALNIKYVDEFLPDYSTMLYNMLIKERETIRGKKKIKARAKPKTVNFFLATVKAFFQQEYIKGHITRNPMIHIKNLRVEKRKPEFYTSEELKLFFSQTMDDAYRLAFMGLVFTGMRFSELANITWDDIDFERNLIFVKSSESFRTKTFNSERAIPLNAVLRDLLTSYYPKRKSDLYIFTSPNGLQLRERKLLAVCKIIAEKAGLANNAYLHKFRHTYATMLIFRGVHIQNIKELLGHWSISETERYAHNSSAYLHNDVSRLDNLLS